MIIKVSKVEREYFATLPEGKWYDCLFCDEESGEQFFVELQKKKDETAIEFAERCLAVALDNFDDVTFCEMVDAYTAEQWGLDTY